MTDETVFQPFANGRVRPGTRLNGVYEVERLIAEGGMGEVFRGFNIQTGDVVAIKMIRPEFMNNQEILEQFRREGSILHNLSHEAIVRYFVFSVDPDIRRAYLAMEFVDGPSLRKRLESGPLPLAEVAVLRQRIAHALEAAHEAGVVHRDISSDNIILPNGDVRRAKVIDFGIARSLTLSDRTLIGDGFAGKYNYASPEQLGLGGGKVTFKSDIYSFGLVLAEAARGRPLDMGGSQADVVEKRRTVPDLSDVDRSIRPLIRSMLEPLAENRPSSMAAVADWRETRRAGAGRSRVEAGGARKPGFPDGRVIWLTGGLAALGLASLLVVFRGDVGRWIEAQVAPTAPSTKPSPGGSAPPPPAPSGPAPPPSASAGSSPPRLAPPASAPPPPASLGSASPPPAPSGAGPPPLAASGSPPPPAASPPAASPGAASPPPSLPAGPVELPPAAAAAPYRAELPAFSGEGLRLAADPLPEGLTFEDLGGGKGVIEGTPARAGSGPVRVLATDAAGRTAQMTAMLVIEAPPNSADREERFVRAYQGGDCFLIRPLPGERNYLGVGDQAEAFQRFYDAFKTALDAEPRLTVRLLAAAECPALDLIRAASDKGPGQPRLELADTRLGRNRPLAGRIGALAGRRAYLVLVDNEGIAYRLETKAQPGGDAATFSVPLTADADSTGPLQVVMAIASAAPIAALETFRSGPIKTLAPHLLEAARAGSTSVGAEYFTFAR